MLVSFVKPENITLSTDPIKAVSNCVQIFLPPLHILILFSCLALPFLSHRVSSINLSFSGRLAFHLSKWTREFLFGLFFFSQNNNRKVKMNIDYNSLNNLESSTLGYNESNAFSNYFLLYWVNVSRSQTINNQICCAGFTYLEWEKMSLKEQWTDHILTQLEQGMNEFEWIMNRSRTRTHSASKFLKEISLWFNKMVH